MGLKHLIAVAVSHAGHSLFEHWLKKKLETSGIGLLSKLLTRIINSVHKSIKKGD